MTGGTISLGYGSILIFLGNSTAASDTITAEGGAVSRGRPGKMTFGDTSKVAE